jgi:hypothetical protein
MDDFDNTVLDIQAFVTALPVHRQGMPDSFSDLSPLPSAVIRGDPFNPPDPFNRPSSPATPLGPAIPEDGWFFLALQ